jgi:imidazole glycerol-phosphate synthase subunit HisH
VIGVISYRTGNAQSVAYALNRLGVANRLVERPDEARDADRFILPGVGSAGVTMASLAEQGWPEFLRERVVEGGQAFLGVCVGLQALFEHSEEDDAKGLGWLPGRVHPFPADQVRVPQIGWNEVTRAGAHPFVAQLPAPGHFYFVNSYYAVPERGSDTAGTTTYGVEFTSVVARGNVMATQFHIEKSGPLGLGLLRRFADLNVSTVEKVC